MYKMIGADGREYGPVSAEQLRAWVVEGRASLQTSVQLEGTTEWKPIAEFPELAVPAAGSLPPLQTAVVTAKIPNYLFQSIGLTLCCCSPFAIPAIAYGIQVKSKLAAGDLAGAQESSRKARLWCWIGLGTGVLIAIVVNWVALAAVQKLLSQ